MTMHLARTTDPVTSHMAAANALAFKGSHAERIFSALQRLRSATAHELSDATGLTVVQIDRRMPELLKAKKIQVQVVAGALQIRGGARVWEIAPKQEVLF